MRGGSVEAWSQGCEVTYLAGAQGQESIGLLRRLNRAVGGYGLSECSNPRSRGSSLAWRKPSSSREQRHGGQQRRDERRAAIWKGNAL